MTEAFWSNKESDPKRKFRWYLQLSVDHGADLLQIAAKTIDKPKFEITNTQHQFINHQFNFPGRVKWNTINATFVDLASSGGDTADVAETFYDLLESSGYARPITKELCRESITKQESVDAWGSNFQILQIGSDGNPIEKWELQNAWISTLEFGSLDYSTEDLVEITATIVYDWAERTKGQ